MIRLFSTLETLRTCDDECLELNTEDILEALFRSTIHYVTIIFTPKLNSYGVHMNLRTLINSDLAPSRPPLRSTGCPPRGQVVWRR